MIITRAPVRISFFGGGTDYPAWYEEHGGAVVATTIDKYNYVICRPLPPFFDYKYRIRYRLTEETQTRDEIQHPSVRECLKYYDIQEGVEVQHNSDLPAMSGLGSSSSFTVGMLHALSAMKGRMLTKRQLSLDAIAVEQQRIGEHVGSQDQTTTAFGGFNHITFGGPQQILVNPITVSNATIAELQGNLMLFFTGAVRIASTIAAQQIQAIPNRTAELQEMQQMVGECLSILNGGDRHLDDFGRLLHTAWQVKRGLTASITTPLVDEIYHTGLSAGALGGKLLGAGGGGFILFYVRREQREKLRQALGKLLHVPFRFEQLGSHVIHYAPNVDC